MGIQDIIQKIKHLSPTAKIIIGILVVGVVATVVAIPITISSSQTEASKKSSSQNSEQVDNPEKDLSKEGNDEQTDGQKSKNQEGNQDDIVVENQLDDSTYPSTNNQYPNTVPNNDVININEATVTPDNNVIDTPNVKPDYNLNDKWVAGYITWPVYKLESGECVEVTSKTFFAVTRFTGSTGDLDRAVMPQYQAYLAENGYTNECGGMGAAYMTWDQAISSGIALDEEKCSAYGLSCGRW